MKKKFKVIFLTVILFIFSKITFAANDENIYEITPVDDSDSDAQSVLDTLVAKMGLYKLADEHEEKAVESVFKDGTELIDAVTRRG